MCLFFAFFFFFWFSVAIAIFQLEAMYKKAHEAIRANPEPIKKPAKEVGFPLFRFEFVSSAMITFYSDLNSSVQYFGTKTAVEKLWTLNVMSETVINF